ncbi:LPXTG cell wall anchor domain-containing protein [uncultured Limosilactobacillus sp.]|uniref:LPXTG cell wall anchor domain-containing protein n=1 Tax=uncultured Limosilactobacillus sp. TaxID=2837629 RepID=UPI0025CDD4F9|nr:LPXTG cell wall anchor domain-containing protein [uncultured Limosilactobacillus sp.]
MKKERRIKNQLAAAIAVGTVLTACQLSIPVQAAQQATGTQSVAKASQVKTICIRLVENGQTLDKIVVTGQAGEAVPISKAKRELFVLTGGDQLTRIPAVFTIPQEGDQIDWTATRRQVSQQQIHDVVVTVQPQANQRTIAGAPTEEINLKVVTIYQYDRLTRRKFDIKYNLAPGEKEVVLPQSLPGYESTDVNGISLLPQDLVKDRKDLSLFLDNDDPTPLHFTVTAHYRVLVTSEDSQHPGEGQTESPEKEDQRQPGSGEMTGHESEKHDETADPVKDNGTGEQPQPDSKAQQETQGEPQDQGDESQQTTEDNNVVGKGTQTEVEAHDKVDSSQQTTEESRDVADVGTQTEEDSHNQVDASQQTADETNDVTDASTQTAAKTQDQVDESQQTGEETSNSVDEGTQTPAEAGGQVDASQQTTAETSYLADEGAKTEVDSHDQADASQQTSEEKNNVVNEGTQTPVEHEPVQTGDKHSEFSTGVKESAAEVHEQSTAGKAATPDEVLVAETDKLSQLDRQTAPSSAKDQLPQTGNSDQGRLIAALGGLISGLTGLITAWVFRRAD